MLIAKFRRTIYILSKTGRRHSTTPRRTTMGIVVEANITNPTESDMMIIKKKVVEHGVIVVKQQPLTPKQLEHVAMALGQRLILDKAFAFGHESDDCPGTTVVSNMDPITGAVIPNHSAAEYWHQDGNFNAGDDKNVWNLLHAVMVPATGGGTGFLDCQRVLKSMPSELLAKARLCRVQLLPSDIPDFSSNDVSAFPPVEHDLVQKHVESGEESLYIASLAIGKLVSGHVSLMGELDDIRESLIGYLEEDENRYVHKWDPGDTLIWDNTLVMHRSMGGYSDSPRKLYRCQARMFLSV